jgi:hypothetical protein
VPEGGTEVQRGHIQQRHPDQDELGPMIVESG